MRMGARMAVAFAIGGVVTPLGNFATEGGVAIAAALRQPAESSPARDKIQALASAITQAQSFSYRVKFHSEGGMFAMGSPVVNLEVLARRDPANPTRWLIKYSGTSSLANQSPTDILVVFRSERYEFASAKDQAVVARPQRTARDKQVDFSLLGSLRQLAEASPLSKELAAPSHEMEDARASGGVQCDVVLIDPGPAQSKGRWFLNAADGMPVRLETVFAGASGGTSDTSGMQIHEISEFRLNPDLPEELFVLPIPDGYKDLRTPAVMPGQTPTPTTPREGGTPASSPTPSAPPPMSRPIGTGVGQIAPDFELAVMGSGGGGATGERFRLSSARGSVVVLDFTATWLNTARQSGKQTQKLLEAFKDKPVKVYSIPCRERGPEAAMDLWRTDGRTSPVLLGGDGVSRQYKVRTFPTVFVIGFEGEVLREAVAFDAKTTEPYPGLVTLIEEYLKNPKMPESGASSASPMTPPEVERGGGPQPDAQPTGQPIGPPQRPALPDSGNEPDAPDRGPDALPENVSDDGRIIFPR